MGKYFKEDNNQRVAKVSELDIESLVERSIRTAQATGFAKWVEETAQIIPGAYRTIKEEAKSLEEAKKRIHWGESKGGATTIQQVKPSKNLTNLAQGRAMSPYVSFGLDVASSLIPSLRPWAELIKLTDKFAALESKFGALTPILETEFTGTIQGGKAKNYTLRQILKNMNKDGVITMGGQNIKFTGAKDIYSKMVELDRIRNTDRFKKMLVALGLGTFVIGGAAIAVNRSANEPGTVKRNEELTRIQKAPKQPEVQDITSEEALKKANENL